jgi:hypothetical protein
MNSMVYGYHARRIVSIVQTNKIKEQKQQDMAPSQRWIDDNKKIHTLASQPCTQSDKSLSPAGDKHLVTKNLPHARLPLPKTQVTGKLKQFIRTY